jgi:Zn-dependent peptidase ImmA (M78 family)/transcriptional regulator with XRE-family HTH domain
MKEKINTRMIVLAREARSLNQHALADSINISATNLSKIERGDIGISEEMLKAIAGTTGFPIHFFHQPGGIVPGHLAYRKRNTVAQRLLSPINAKANILRRHVHFFTTALQIPVPLLPSIEINETPDIETASVELRKSLGLGEGPIENLIAILEGLNLPVLSFDFGTERVDSRSLFTDHHHPVIFLNSRLLGDRERFSLAYELAQLVIHTSGSLPPDRDISHEANLFAAGFLMPRRAIMEDFKGGITIPLLGELKKKWKVSMIALLYRADDLGCITPNQKRYLLQQFNQLQIRRREPIELDVPIEQGELMKKWIRLYREDTGLGLIEIATLLCLNRDEFFELYA